MPYHSRWICDVKFVDQDDMEVIVTCFIVGNRGPYRTRVVKCGLEKEQSIKVLNDRVSNVRPAPDVAAGAEPFGNPALLQGVATAELGAWLTSLVRGDPRYQGLEVFFDHGDRRVNQNVVATKGFCGINVCNANRLADVDLVVVGPRGETILLTEIEEKPCSPKKLLGDVLAVLLCNRFAVLQAGTQRYFTISSRTHFIVAGAVPAEGGRLQKIDRVIAPRLRSFAAPADAVRCENVVLLFRPTIGEAIQCLKEKIAEILEDWIRQR